MEKFYCYPQYTNDVTDIHIIFESKDLPTLLAQLSKSQFWVQNQNDSVGFRVNFIISKEKYDNALNTIV